MSLQQPRGHLEAFMTLGVAEKLGSRIFLTGAVPSHAPRALTRPRCSAMHAASLAPKRGCKTQ